MQRQNAYTQAIYETGARLTHDVKNLLQSLRSLCAAAETSSADEAAALQALMQRQLPQITQRLSATLDKLRAPQEADLKRVDAGTWWEALTRRHSGRNNLQFIIDGAAKDLTLPAELFDSVADNLIQNALGKPAQRQGAGCPRHVFAGARRHVERLRQRRGGERQCRRPVVRGAGAVPYRARRRALPCGETGRPVRLPPDACGQRARQGVFRAGARNSGLMEGRSGQLAG